METGRSRGFQSVQWLHKNGPRQTYLLSLDPPPSTLLSTAACLLAQKSAPLAPPALPYIRICVSRRGYLQFLVDSKVVYEALEEACASDPRLSEFRDTGLERSAALTKVRYGAARFGGVAVGVIQRVERLEQVGGVEYSRVAQGRVEER